MKKLTTVFAVVGAFVVSAVFAGCSSAKKDVVEAAPAVQVQQAETSPVNLGASSSGRGL